MAKRCVICDKGTGTGNTVSHSQRKGRRTWAPNLQKVRIIHEGKHVRANVCTRCLKSGKAERAI